MHSAILLMALTVRLANRDPLLITLQYRCHLENFPAYERFQFRYSKIYLWKVNIPGPDLKHLNYIPWTTRPRPRKQWQLERSSDPGLAHIGKLPSERWSCSSKEIWCPMAL